MKFIVFFTLILYMTSCVQDSKPTFRLKSTTEELELFAPEIISTHLYERDMAIHPSGDEIIYTLGNQKQTKRSLVHLSNFNGSWSDPKIINISGIYQDIEPFYANNGNRLFFASNRPMPGESEIGDYNIWYSDRGEIIWTDPIALGIEINTDGDEFYPSISSNQNLYYTATRDDGIGREDIFVSKYTDGRYQIPAVLDSNVNTQYFEFNAYIHPNEQLIIYSSYGRSDDIGGGDLYFSTKDADGSWIAAKNMGKRINSAQLDYCPFIDVPNGMLYFTSERYDNDDSIMTVERLNMASQRPKNGFGDIYIIPVSESIIAESWPL